MPDRFTWLARFNLATGSENGNRNGVFVQSQQPDGRDLPVTGERAWGRIGPTAGSSYGSSCANWATVWARPLRGGVGLRESIWRVSTET